MIPVPVLKDTITLLPKAEQLREILILDPDIKTKATRKLRKSGIVNNTTLRSGHYIKTLLSPKQLLADKAIVGFDLNMHRNKGHIRKD